MKTRTDEEFYLIVEGLVKNNSRDANLQSQLKLELTKEQIAAIKKAQTVFAEFSSELSQQLMPELQAAHKLSESRKKRKLAEINSQTEAKLRDKFGGLVDSIEHALLAPQLKTIKKYSLRRALESQLPFDKDVLTFPYFISFGLDLTDAERKKVLKASRKALEEFDDTLQKKTR